jgi:hypothetical protein
VTLRLVLVGAILVVSVMVAVVLERRRVARTRPVDAKVGAAHAPGQVDRWDFDRPGAPWLVVLFSSRECAGCGPVAEQVRSLETPDVAVDEVEWSEGRDLHRKYAIEGVPVVVLVDRLGVTRAEFVGAESMPDMPSRILARIAEQR